MKDHEINNTIDRLIDPKNRLLPYTRSLDACAEFEKTITSESDKNHYVNLLNQIYDEFGELSNVCSDFMLATATAVQRCEAYLRMKGLWSE